jgi:hypothetical protein
VTRRRAAVLGAVVIVGVLVIRYFVWVDVGTRCVIGIRPSPVGYDNSTVKRALETLRHGSPEDYRKVCTHVGSINPIPPAAGLEAAASGTARTRAAGPAST